MYSLAKTDPDHTPVLVQGGGWRTAFTRAARGDRPGQLSGLPSDDLAVLVINNIIDTTGIDPAHIEAVLMGCAFPEGPNGLNVAHMLSRHRYSLLPETAGGTTVNKFCGSSMQTIHDAAAAIASPLTGYDHPVYIAGGMEDMSSNPNMMGGRPSLNPHVKSNVPRTSLDMLFTGENLAELYSISRAEQDAFALRSQMNAAKAEKDNWTAGEIVPVAVARKENGREYVRFDTMPVPAHRFVIEDDSIQSYDSEADGLAQLAQMRPVKKGFSITAATAAPTADGVSAVMVTSEAYALRNGLPILARILACAQSGCAPEIMGIGPVESTRKVVRASGIPLIHALELNEAFAPQSLAVLKEFNRQGIPFDMDGVNMHGGALARNHPLGATGARIVMTLARTLAESAGKPKELNYGVATMCIGLGQGIATALERGTIPRAPV